MCKSQHRVSDELWEKIAPFLPKYVNTHRLCDGQPKADDRKRIDDIFCDHSGLKLGFLRQWRHYGDVATTIPKLAWLLQNNTFATLGELACQTDNRQQLMTLSMSRAPAMAVEVQRHKSGHHTVSEEPHPA